MRYTGGGIGHSLLRLEKPDLQTLTLAYPSSAEFSEQEPEAADVNVDHREDLTDDEMRSDNEDREDEDTDLMSDSASELEEF